MFFNSKKRKEIKENEARLMRINGQVKSKYKCIYGIIYSCKKTIEEV